MSDRASSPNLIETGLNGLKSLIGGGRDNYPLISGTNGKHQIYVPSFMMTFYADPRPTLSERLSVIVVLPTNAHLSISITKVKCM